MPQTLRKSVSIYHEHKKKYSYWRPTSQKEQIQKRLTILQDLKKINELKQLCISQDDGSTLDYCTLAEEIGGVTEKSL